MLIVLDTEADTDQACLADFVVSFTQLLLYFRVIWHSAAELLVHLLYLTQQCPLCLDRGTKDNQPKVKVAEQKNAAAWVGFNDTVWHQILHFFLLIYILTNLSWSLELLECLVSLFLLGFRPLLSFSQTLSQLAQLCVNLLPLLKHKGSM